MYIDKKIKEHTLLQAIARTNRIKQGKQRGYIVDYIGLANHLTEALTIYASSDEQQELAEGLKNINSELPVLEERYNRLLQLFKSNNVENIKNYAEGRLASAEDDAVVVHSAVKLLKNEKLRADFDVFMKKFMSSMDVILPNSAAGPYRVPAKRFGYILRVTKERYKDDSLNLGNAGEKIKALINEHLISLGINPKVPPVELLADDFMEKLSLHSGKNPEAKASEMEHAIRRHCTVHHDEDPAFYKSLSEKVDNLIDLYKDNWESLLEELEKIRGEVAEGSRCFL
jgi:type I restriction enzyme R subunit